jgi:hypothetical protein
VGARLQAGIGEVAVVHPPDLVTEAIGHHHGEVELIESTVRLLAQSPTDGREVPARFARPGGMVAWKGMLPAFQAGSTLNPKFQAARL